MAKARILFLLALPVIFLACGILSGEQSKESGTKRQITEAEIKKLVGDLGNANFGVREAATKRVAEIGIVALETLENALRDGDAETRQRSATLIEVIRSENHLPRKVDGLEFKLKVPAVWKMPLAGSTSAFTVALEIRNTLEKKCRICAMYPARIELADGKGQKLIARRGYGATVIGPTSAPLEKGQTFTINYRAELLDSKGGLTFVFGGNSSVFYSYDKLIPQVYRLSLVFENAKQATDGGEPFWIGVVKTLPEAVNIE